MFVEKDLQDPSAYDSRGLTPFIATRLYEASKTEANPSGDPYAGLMYPIVIASVCFIIGTLYISNKIDKNVLD